MTARCISPRWTWKSGASPIAITATWRRSEPHGRAPRDGRSRWRTAITRGDTDTGAAHRPSWIVTDAEIAATGADYVALGHWNRPVRVGNGTVPAWYSGSPDLARTVNRVALSTDGTVTVSREEILWD